MLASALKRRLVAATALAFTGQALLSGAHAGVWINEFHYDNASADQGEFFEIAGTAGTDLTDWSIVLYNGTNSQRSPYGTLDLSGILGDDADGFGFQTYDRAGIQNGSPDGFALVDNTGSVVEFLSYEGSFTAASGAAAGLTSTDIGVFEPSNAPVGVSLQRTGTGTEASDFTWAAPQPQTRNALNVGQSFGGATGGNGDGDNGGMDGGEGGSAQTVAIYDIQGSGHRSTFEGQTVRTNGIVTGLTGSGFYVQDAAGDGNDATSDGIFVFTGGAPTVAVGDGVTVEGRITEFRRGSQTEGLTLTEFSSSGLSVTVDSTGNTVPVAVTIGTGGRTPPTQTIDDDRLTSFDPTTDGIDFYESLEGMLVALPDAQAVSTANNFGEIYAIGQVATGVNDFGGITISEGDMNPERIQIQNNGALGDVAATEVGDKIGTVTGHVGYSFSDYEIVVNGDVSVTEAANNTPEVTTLVSNDRTMTVATFNALLQNRFNQPTQEQVEGIAAQIVQNLQSPDVIGLQEVQVDFANGGAEALIEAIVALGGPEYQLAFVDGNSAFNSTSIQPAFLYGPDVALEGVELMSNGIPSATNTAFDGGQRVPLVGTFTFNGETFTIVNNHFDSKSGSSPAFGSTQPPVNGGEADRAAQAQLVNEFVDGFLQQNPDANVLVLGDFNAFSFEEALAEILTGADNVLTNLDYLVTDVTDRFTFNFEGNSQALDHIFANMNIIEGFELALDFLHINSLFSDGASDHDPIIVSIANVGQEVPLPAAFWAMLMGLGALLRFGRRAS